MSLCIKKKIACVKKNTFRDWMCDFEAHVIQCLASIDRFGAVDVRSKINLKNN